MANSAPPLRRMNSEVFIPSSGSLIIRDILADGNEIPTDTYRKSGHLRRPATMGGQRFGKLSMSSFFTRHNPHPKRVHHFKGLLDVPLCGVYDWDKANRMYSLDWPPHTLNKSQVNLPTESINVNSSKYPMDTLTGLHYFHPLKEFAFSEAHPNFSAQQPEISEPWRDELAKIAEAAGLTPRETPEDKPESRCASRYSAQTGRLIPAPSRGLSRGRTSATAQQRFLDSLTGGDGRPAEGEAGVQNTVMTMLCQILQTDNVEAVQDWLTKAGEQEKNMVKELISAAMSGSDQSYPTRYPVAEYMLNLDGSPMTPDIGTTIGENVQNRLSSIHEEDPPLIEQPSTVTIPNRPTTPDETVEQVIARITNETPDKLLPVQLHKSPLPPIGETTIPISPSKSAVLPISPPKSATRLTNSSLMKKPQATKGFNTALENVTRRTLEKLSMKRTDPNLKKFTRYPLDQSSLVTEAAQDDIRATMASAMAQRLRTPKVETNTETQSWQPMSSLPQAVQ